MKIKSYTYGTNHPVKSTCGLWTKSQKSFFLDKVCLKGVYEQNRTVAGKAQLENTLPWSKSILYTCIYSILSDAAGLTGCRVYK
jgi:hypothetical protein